jgi:hypothetical protein
VILVAMPTPEPDLTCSSEAPEIQPKIQPTRYYHNRPASGTTCPKGLRPGTVCPVRFLSSLGFDLKSVTYSPSNFGETRASRKASRRSRSYAAIKSNC